MQDVWKADALSVKDLGTHVACRQTSRCHRIRFQDPHGPDVNVHWFRDPSVRKHTPEG